MAAATPRYLPFAAFHEKKAIKHKYAIEGDQSAVLCGSANKNSRSFHCRAEVMGTFKLIRLIDWLVDYMNIYK